MTLRIIVAIFAAFVMAALFYGFGAFIAWNANPGQWTSDGRFILCMFYFVLSSAVCTGIIGSTE